MRVEINSELEPGGATLEIPWASAHHTCLKYVDLSRFPEGIATLPECRNNPALARLLQRVNRPGSIFRTAKCDTWVTSKLKEDEDLDFELPFKAGGYVDLVFERPSLRSRLEAQLRIAKNLEKSLAMCLLQARMDIVARRCLFHKKGKWGYALTLFVYAYGATRLQAKKEWGRALDSLGDALMSVAPRLNKKRTKQLDRRTVGAL